MSINETIIKYLSENPPKTEIDFSESLRKILRQENDPKISIPNKQVLLKSYHKLVRTGKIKKSVQLERILRRRAVRTLSGVTIVTSLVKPYPCPGKCVYCPLDARMPKSYLSDEPAAARALTLEFSPYDQMAKRIEALQNNGHPTDKIELIIKGGTWNSYPLPYQYWFILKSFEAANRTSIKNKTRATKLNEHSSLKKLRAELTKQQKLNEVAKHRIIGLTLETRPDCVNLRTVWQMREMGCTRIELGIQHTDDAILKLIKRGHDNARSKLATQFLKNYGYKTDFHLMPQLPGATPETDLAMMINVFEDPGLRPDMIKVYPCSVIKNSELYDWFKEGKYKAYPTEDLLRILKEFKPHVPRYCRISRLIRDIPGQYIEDGNKITNLRQVIQEQMKKEGKKCVCLRCREISHVDIAEIKDLTPHLFIDEYETQGGTEYFLSFENKDRQVVFAFCRLRIVDQATYKKDRKLSPFPAYIRELHTYGQLVKIGMQEKESSQHKGLGKKLIIMAEKITQEKGIAKIAVISGVGVRDYYRHIGYRLENTYMVKRLKR
jgi:elongator complex protein 3